MLYTFFEIGYTPKQVHTLRLAFKLNRICSV
jgi:hypothetical protein